MLHLSRPRITNRSRLRAAVAVLLAIIAWSACATPEDEDGSATIGVAVSSLSAADVTRVVVTITGTGISTPVTAELARETTGWHGLITKIPAGTNRAFSAQAYAGTVLVYSGTTTGVTIAPGPATAVYLVLQPQTAPPPFMNAAPIIDSVIASRNSLAPSESIDLIVRAHDANPGDSLTIHWTASVGSFSDSASSTPTWLAPTTEGPATLTVQVTDSKAATQSLSFVVQVANGNASGKADVHASVNTWPVVSGLTASSNQVNAGQSTTLNLQVSDADGDPLTIAWTDGGCAGTFSSTTALAPAWTAPPSISGITSCTLRANITDGRGGSTSASLTIAMGAGPTVNIAPTITNTFQSSNSVAPSGSVLVKVTATDPEGQALTFAWSATDGTLSAPTTTATTSEITWLAPPTGCDHSITVTVSDPRGASTKETFAVNSCATPPAGPQLGGCPVLPANNVLNTAIDSLPTHPSSAAYIASIGGANKLRLDMGTQTDQQAGDYYGIPYNLVSGTSFTWPLVTFDAGNGFPDESDCADASHNLLSPCTASSAYLPISATVKVENGVQTAPVGDHHLLIVDTTSCRLWEAYLAYQPQPGKWTIGNSAMFDLRSNNLRPDGWTSTDAAGLPILPLLLRADEATTGEIQHALRITLPRTMLRNTHVWPARHSTGGATSTSYAPMGQLFRLKASYTIPSTYTTQAKAILQALKTYGAYAADIGSTMYLQGEPSALWQPATFTQVNTVTAADFEAVDVGPIMSRPGFDPNSGAVPAP